MEGDTVTLREQRDQRRIWLFDQLSRREPVFKALERALREHFQDLDYAKALAIAAILDETEECNLSDLLVVKELINRVRANEEVMFG